MGSERLAMEKLCEIFAWLPSVCFSTTRSLTHQPVLGAHSGAHCVHPRDDLDTSVPPKHLHRKKTEQGKCKQQDRKR